MRAKPRALIYGASKGGARAFLAYSKVFDIVGFIDADVTKQGRSRFKGLNVLSPEQSLTTEAEFILVATGAVTSVKEFYSQTSQVFAKLVVVPNSIRLGYDKRGKIIAALLVAYALLPIFLSIALWTK